MSIILPINLFLEKKNRKSPDCHTKIHEELNKCLHSTPGVSWMVKTENPD